MVTIDSNQSFSTEIGKLTYFRPSYSGNVSSWSGSGLPAGLKVDQVSGFVFGVPTQGRTPFLEEYGPEEFSDKANWSAQVYAVESGTNQIYSQNIDIEVGYSFPAIVNGFLIEGQVGVPFSHSLTFPDSIAERTSFNNRNISEIESPTSAIFFGTGSWPSGTYVNNLFYNKTLSEFKDLPPGLKHVGGGLIEGIPTQAGRFTVSVTSFDIRIAGGEQKSTSSIEILIHSSQTISYPSDSLPSKKIAGSQGSMVILNKDGTCTFHGENKMGQHDTFTTSGEVTQSINGSIKDVQMGFTACFALKQDGSIASWGRLCERQYKPAGNDFTKIAYGGFQGLALKSNGTVVGLGSRHGSCDPNDPFIPHSSILQATNVQDIFVAPTTLSWCYALLSNNKLVGTSNRSPQYISYDDDPSEVDSLGCPTGNYTHVSLSMYHGLALRTDGTVLSFGQQFYDSSATEEFKAPRKTPVGLTSVKKIFAGMIGHNANFAYDTSIAIKENGEIVCWGPGGHLFELILSEYGLNLSSGELIDDIVIRAGCTAILLKNGTVFNYELQGYPCFQSIGIVDPQEQARIEDKKILNLPTNSKVFEKLKVLRGDVNSFSPASLALPSGLSFDSKRGIIYGTTSQEISQEYQIAPQKDPSYLNLNLKPGVQNLYDWQHKFKINTKRKKAFLTKEDKFTVIIPTYFYSKVNGNNRFRVFNGSPDDRILWSIDGRSFIGMASGTFVHNGNYVDEPLTKGWHRIVFAYQKNLNGNDNPSGCIKIQHDTKNQFYAPADIFSCLNKNAKTCLSSIASIEDLDGDGLSILTEKLFGLVYVTSTGETNLGKWTNSSVPLALDNFTLGEPTGTIHFINGRSGGIAFVNSIQDIYSTTVLNNKPFGTETNGALTGTDIYSWPLIVYPDLSTPTPTPTPTITPTKTPTPTPTITPTKTPTPTPTITQPVTIKQIKWNKIGRIATPAEAGVLRFTGTFSSSGYISFSNPYYNGGYYKDFRFLYNQNTGTFSSSTEYSQTISNLASAFPISNSGNLAYRTQIPSAAFARYLGTTYTLHTSGAGQLLVGLDANPELYIAYSYTGTGGSTRFLKYGQFFVFDGDGQVGGFVDTGLLGPVSLSRNGLFATVAGVPSGGTSSNTIKVYTTSNGLPPPQNWFTEIQTGDTITIPGIANIEYVKINNTGTRLVVSTESDPSQIYTYELVSGSWILRDTINLSGAGLARGLAFSSSGDLMSFRGNDFANSYSWNSDSKSWSLQDVTNIPYPAGFPAYQGTTIDISEDGQYMAVDMWPTTNSTAIEIYKSTITDVTITPTPTPTITPGSSTPAPTITPTKTLTPTPTITPGSSTPAPTITPTKTLTPTPTAVQVFGSNKKYISLWMPELGLGLGQDFQLSCSSGQVSPSAVKRFELIKGTNVEVPSSATSITITPTNGSCQNPITIQINNNCQGGECSIQAYASCSNAVGTDVGDGNSTPSQTPTPTLTPTPIVNPAILSWEESTLPSSLYWQSVDYVNGKYFALANGTLGAYSDDAISWTQIILPNNGWRNVTFGNGRYVATGFGTTGAYSDDGVTWTASIMPSSQNWRTVTFGNGKFVTIAHESNKAAYSNDGINWTETILPRSSYWVSIAYGGGKFVAISSFGNEAAYSSDGITWNRSLLPDEPIIPSGAVRSCGSGLIYANGRFLAIASQFQSASLALYSNDGVNWTQVPLVDNSGNPVTEIGYSLTYGNNGFFSTGTSISNIGAFSIDGIHWTKITLPSSKGWIYSTYGGNGRYVTIGNNSNIIAYSSPVSATPTPTPTPTPTKTPTPTPTPISSSSSSIIWQNYPYASWTGSTNVAVTLIGGAGGNLSLNNPLSRSSMTSFDQVGSKVPNGGNVDLSNCTSLTNLNIFNIGITNLNITGNVALQVLMLDNNNLSGTLDCRGLTALDTLRCQSNQFTSLNCSGLQNLTSIDLKLNPTLNSGTIEIGNSPKLKELDLHGCGLDTIIVDLLLARMLNIAQANGLTNGRIQLTGNSCPGSTGQSVIPALLARGYSVSVNSNCAGQNPTPTPTPTPTKTPTPTPTSTANNLNAWAKALLSLDILDSEYSEINYYNL